MRNTKGENVVGRCRVGDGSERESGDMVVGIVNAGVCGETEEEGEK